MDRIITFLSGGLVAIFLYLLLIFGFAYLYLDSLFTPKSYSPKTETTITMVDIQLENIEEKGKEEEKVEEKKEEGSETPKTSPFDKNLLQNLENYKQEPKKEIQPESSNDKSASRKKGERSEPKKSVKEMVDALNIKNVNLKKMSLKPNAGESDPYFDKIYEILSDWVPTNDALKATVVLNITNSGYFTYSLKDSSGDKAFDESIIKFLDGLNRTLPPHTKANTIAIEVNFKKKE